MQAILGILLTLFGYLLGSMPSGFWIARKIKGKDFDIRDWGSHNVGFTNVKRVLGWRAALPVLALDFLKGYLPVKLACFVFSTNIAFFVMFAAMIGHAYSLYFKIKERKFSGGKSVDTTFGAIVALNPLYGLLVFMVFVIVLVTARYLSVASMSAAVFAFAGTFIFGLGTNWSIVFGAVMLFIIYTHLRNISNLINRTESRFFGRKTILGQETIKTAFGVHSRSIESLSQSPQSSWLLRLFEKGIISERTVRKIIARSPVMVFDRITGIQNPQGIMAEVEVLGIPLMPDQVKDPHNQPLLYSLLKAGAVLSQRRGATVFGLGALLSSEARGGLDLQQWARDERRLSIVIDNGAAATVAATLIALKKIIPDTSSLVVAILGAFGAIGMPLVKYFRGHPGLAQRIMQFGRIRSMVQKAHGLEDIFGTDKDMISLREADVVIFATSATDYLLIQSNKDCLKKDAVILDISVPPNVEDSVLAEFSGFRSGLIKLPGHAKTMRADFGFGSIIVDGQKHQLFPACLAEGLILAYEGLKDPESYKMASVGLNVTPEMVDWYIEKLDEHGFEVILSPICEQEVFDDKKRPNNQSQNAEAGK